MLHIENLLIEVAIGLTIAFFLLLIVAYLLEYFLNPREKINH